MSNELISSPELVTDAEKFTVIYVALKDALKNYDKLWTYLYPDNFSEPQLGQRVLVPFGSKNILKEAYIFIIVNYSSTERGDIVCADQRLLPYYQNNYDFSYEYINELKRNLKLKTPKQVFTETLIPDKNQLYLAELMASYYNCSRLKALSLMYPSYLNIKKKEVLIIDKRETEKLKFQTASFLSSSFWDYLIKQRVSPFSMSYRQALQEDKKFQNLFDDKKNTLLKTYSFFTVDLFKKYLRYFFADILHEDLSEVSCSSILNLLFKIDGVHYCKFYEFGNTRYFYSISDKNEALLYLNNGGFNDEALNMAVELLLEGDLSEDELCRYGYVKNKDLKILNSLTFIRKYKSEDKSKPEDKSNDDLSYTDYPSGIVLNEEQNSVYHNLKMKLQSDEYSENLLFGVTGSGKTEIYLNLAEEALKAGKSAIILIPEISLTSQMIARFEKRFASQMAVLHSALTTKERFQNWEKIKKARAKLILGARSAVFAPCSNLGLIIIDEEHDSSYQSQINPYYDARTVARMRLKDGGLLLLASATPAINTYYYFLNKYPQNILRLTKRPGHAVLPKVYIEDISENKSKSSSYLISDKIKSSLQLCFDKKEQAMFLINRRGFAAKYICLDCCSDILCPKCEIPLHYHAAKNRLLCHHCNYSTTVYKTCPYCSSSNIYAKNEAIEAYENELKTLFPKQKILRMDFDSVNARNSHENILNKFRNEDYDLLIGTQMIAKGHDFPNVSFVAICALDHILYMDNIYDSHELYFQLICQTAGRAGRSDIPGKVIVESSNIDNYALTYACLQDYEAFYNVELAYRKEKELPPFVTVMELMLTVKKEKDSFKFMNIILQSLRQKLLKCEKYKEGSFEAAYPYKFNNQYRWIYKLYFYNKNNAFSMRNYLESIKLSSGCSLKVKLYPW